MNNNRILPWVLAGVLGTGCTVEALHAAGTGTVKTITASAGTTTVTTASGTTVLTASAMELDAEDSDESYDESKASVITMNGSGVSISGSGVSAAGPAVTITEAGTYVFTGTPGRRQHHRQLHRQRHRPHRPEGRFHHLIHRIGPLCRAGGQDDCHRRGGHGKHSAGSGFLCGQ
jgi:hypothetical protein